MGCHALLPGIFPTHVLRLLRWQTGSLPLVPPGKSGGPPRRGQNKGQGGVKTMGQAGSPREATGCLDSPWLVVPGQQPCAWGGGWCFVRRCPCVCLLCISKNKCSISTAIIASLGHFHTGNVKHAISRWLMSIFLLSDTSY